jgi:Rrf2 family protein
MKSTILLSLLFLNVAWAAPRIQMMDMNIDREGKHLILEVHTEEQNSLAEMSFYIYQPGGSRDFIRRIVPASSPGVYRLEYTFPQDGYWEINLRHGIGLDRYYAGVDLNIDDFSQNYTRRTVFQGDLDTRAPRYIQSIGFAVFGLLLFTTLMLIGAILRFIKPSDVIVNKPVIENTVKPHCNTKTYLLQYILMVSLTQKAKYALKALVFLSKEQQRGPILISEISEREHIPKKFLESILLELKNHGLLQSKMGKGGGYWLNKDPNSIYFGHVIRIFDGALAPIPCTAKRYYKRCDECIDENTCEIRKVMFTVKAAILNVLDKTSIANTVNSDSMNDILD